MNLARVRAQLLAKKPSERLGSGQTAERDVKNHAFYRRVDWDKMANRDIQPPFKPRTVLCCADARSHRP